MELKEKEKVNFKREEFLVFLFFVAITFILFKETIFIRWFHAGVDPDNTLIHPDISPILKQSFPLWNPYIFFGFPLLAESINYGLLSPFTILRLLLQNLLGFSSFFSFNFVYILHFPLASFFMYLYARSIGIGKVGAIISGIIFTYTGIFLEEPGDRAVFDTYTWFPLILFFLEKSLTDLNIKWRYVILVGFFYGIQFLGGDTQHSYYFSIFLIFYLLFKYTMRIKDGFSKKEETKRFIFTFLLIFIIGVGIFGVQLLPTYELAKQSARFYFKIYEPGVFLDNLSFKRMLGMVIPNNPEDCELFIGIIPLLMVLYVLIFLKNRYKFFLFSLLLCSLLLSTKWIIKLCQFLPFFSFFKDHIRIIYFFFFSVAILNGIGWENIIRKYKKIGVVILILMIIEIYRGWTYSYRYRYLNKLKQHKISRSYNNIFRMIKTKDKLYRVWMDSDISNSILRFYHSNGFSNLVLKRYLEFTHTSTDIDYLKGDSYPDFLYYPNYLALSNIKYIVIPNKEDKPYFHREDLFTKVYKDEEYTLYKFKKVLPRAFFARKFRVIVNKNNLLKYLKNSAFQPHKEVVVEDLSLLSLSNIQELREEALKDSEVVKVDITYFTPLEVIVNLKNQRPGLLVFSDTYYPGWKVYVDSKESKIYRANYLFRAVYIPYGGKHTVKFIYSPKLFKLGSIISGITFIASGIGLILSKR